MPDIEFPSTPLIAEWDILVGFPGRKGDQGDPGTTDFNELENVPETFPPSAHTHSAAALAEMLNIPSYADLAAANAALSIGKIFFNTTTSTLEVTTA